MKVIKSTTIPLLLAVKVNAFAPVRIPFKGSLCVVNMENPEDQYYEDGGDELGFNEPNPYADQYEPEEQTLVTEKMEEIMNTLAYDSVSSEAGYVAAAKSRAEEARKQKAEAEQRGESLEDFTPVYKSSILLSDGAKQQVESSNASQNSSSGGVKEAVRSENSDIMFVDGEDDDGSLLVF